MIILAWIEREKRVEKEEEGNNRTGTGALQVARLPVLLAKMLLFLSSQCPLIYVHSTVLPVDCHEFEP